MKITEIALRQIEALEEEVERAKEQNRVLREAGRALLKELEDNNTYRLSGDIDPFCDDLEQAISTTGEDNNGK